MLDQLIALTIFAFVASATPGPNNIMLLTSGVNFGFYRTLPHVLGVILGFSFLIFCVGLGLGTLFTALPILHIALKIGGSVYLVYLAWRIATTRSLSQGKNNANPLKFIEASLFQWANPKAWATSVTAIAVYTSSDNPYLSLLLITLTFLCVSVPSTMIWTGFGTALRRYLESPTFLKWFNRTMGLLLVISIMPMVA